MQMNSRLLLNLGLVCDLQKQDSAAVNYFKKVLLDKFMLDKKKTLFIKEAFCLLLRQAT